MVNRIITIVLSLVSFLSFYVEAYMLTSADIGRANRTFCSQLSGSHIDQFTVVRTACFVLQNDSLRLEVIADLSLHLSNIVARSDMSRTSLTEGLLARAENFSARVMMLPIIEAHSIGEELRRLDNVSTFSVTLVYVFADGEIIRVETSKRIG
ncbi:hypothetical protein VB10N_40320 [Vibrio sp. 10N]|nr:hypothetical protein VB10N_40320 [Vibrio sp. 10N]